MIESEQCYFSPGSSTPGWVCAVDTLGSIIAQSWQRPGCWGNGAPDRHGGHGSRQSRGPWRWWGAGTTPKHITTIQISEAVAAQNSRARHLLGSVLQAQHWLACSPQSHERTSACESHVKQLRKHDQTSAGTASSSAPAGVRPAWGGSSDCRHGDMGFIRCRRPSMNWKLGPPGCIRTSTCTISTGPTTPTA